MILDVSWRQWRCVFGLCFLSERVGFVRSVRPLRSWLVHKMHESISLARVLERFFCSCLSTPAPPLLLLLWYGGLP